MNKVSIVEFPSNLGLKEQIDGLEPGVKKLPDWLRKHKFHDLIKAESVCRLNPPDYSVEPDKESGVRNAEKIVQYAKQQVVVLEKVLLEKEFPLVIGGDCSILIGNMLALKKRGRYALFFLDGHTDFIKPELSDTGGAAGMDLAIVTGHGHSALTDIDNLKPYIKEELTWCVGNREYDEKYIEPILNSKINYYDLNTVRRVGIQQCISDFFSMISNYNADGFWIHLDVDVLNHRIMPAVDSRKKDGLTYEELDQLLRLLLANTKAAGLEITILDPDLDPTGQYTQEFVYSFCNSFNSIRKSR